MASTDPVADLLTKIRNASRAGHPMVEVRASRLAQCLLEVLKQEGFIRAFQPIGEQPADRWLRVQLKYIRSKPAITQVVRISKPGQRRYERASSLPRVLSGLGTAVISTSKGLMTERDAYRQRLGGEVVCYVW